MVRMRRVIAAIVCFFLVSCTAPGQPRASASEARSPSMSTGGQQDRHPDWPARSNGRFRIAIRVPPAWSLVWNPLRDGTVGDVMLVGSWRFSDLPACVQIPRGEALLSLSEVVPLIASSDYTENQLDRSFPPKSHRFRITDLRSGGVAKGCEQQRAQLFSFREDGRFLYAWAMFGRDLSTGIRTKAEAILSTVHADGPSQDRSPTDSAGTMN